jgi:hypothetical protein
MTAKKDIDADDGKSTVLPDSEEKSDNGAQLANFGSTSAQTDVDAPAFRGEADLSVHGEWLDDEPGHVSIKFSVQGLEAYISLSPADAEQLAAKIRSAAAYAEGEDR